MIDNRTPRLGLLLPDADNYLEDDVHRLSESLTILDGKVATVGTDGKIPVDQIPAVAITDTFAVNTESAMLALNAQPGDVAIRGDLNKTFILMQAPATTLANWKELLNDALVQLGKWDIGGAKLIAMQQAGTGAVPRTQSDKNAEVVSIMDFGAVSGQDSTSALVAALSTGMRIYVPDGLFLISATTITGVDNITIYGHGTLLLTGTAGLIFSGCNSLSISGVKIVCAGPGSTGLKLVSCSNFYLSELVVSAHGVGGGIRCESCYKGRIVNNKFEAAATDNTFGASTSCDVNLWGSNGGILISGNDMVSGGGYAIQARAHSSGDICNGISIIGNYIDGYNSYGINLYRNKQSASDTQVMIFNIVANNVIRNITGARPATPGGDDKTFGCAIYIQGAEYTKVIGNDIYDVCSGTNNDLLAPAGVGVTNCGNYLIVSNTIKKSNYYGIKVNDSVLNADNTVGIGEKNGRGLVFGNIIEDVSLDGVMIQDRNNVEVASNSILNAGRGGIQVNTSPSSTTFPVTTNKTIRGNTLVNITGSAIYVGYTKAFNIDGNNINACSQGISIGFSSVGNVLNNNINGATTRAIYLSPNNTLAGSITVGCNYVENSPVGIVIEHPVNYLDNPNGNPSGTYAEFRSVTADNPNVWGLSFANVDPVSPINITNFVGGKVGQKVSLWINNGNTTFIDSSAFMLKGRANYNPVSNVVMTFMKTKAGWIEISRSA